MTPEEWDRATPEKRVLHQFLAAMRECRRPDGTPLRGDEFKTAMLELVTDGPAAGMTPELDAILRFLYGADVLDGVMFGDKPVGKPRYWWRSKLRDAVRVAFGVRHT